MLTCEQGCLEDVRLLVEGHDVVETGMSVKAMVNKEGKCSYGESVTPLAAACWSNHSAIRVFSARMQSTHLCAFVFFCQLCDSADLQWLKDIVNFHNEEETGMSLKRMVSQED